MCYNIDERGIMKEMIINVNGMKCVGCENSINSAISKLDGIIEVKANHEKNIVTVKYDNTDIKSIYETIEDLGFDVVK